MPLILPYNRSFSKLNKDEDLQIFIDDEFENAKWHAEDLLEVLDHCFKLKATIKITAFEDLPLILSEGPISYYDINMEREGTLTKEVGTLALTLFYLQHSIDMLNYYDREDEAERVYSIALRYQKIAHDTLSDEEYSSLVKFVDDEDE